MPVPQRRVFRIEKALNGHQSDAPTDHLLAEVRHREMMKEISELKKVVQQGAQGNSGDAEVAREKQLSAISHELLEDLAETKRLQFELKEVHNAIERTKREILSLHVQAADGKDIKRVSDELGAIVNGTEHATETILASAEEIDQRAAELSAAIKDETLNSAACDIQDNIIKIFEACNFQDLTGQRISKVINAFTYVDDKITKMLEIWGGIESFKTIELPEREDRRADADLLNGPALETDMGVATQDDIDALFD